MKRLRLGILSVDAEHTTARYYEKAAECMGEEFLTLDTLRPARRRSGVQDADALLVVDPWLSQPERLRDLELPTAAVLIDVHLHLEMRVLFSLYVDHVFVAQRDYVDEFKKRGHPSVFWLPLACDPETHSVPGLPRTIDVSFVGQMSAPESERHKVLTRVLSRFQTNDYHRFHSPKEMGATYSRSKIVFNKSVQGDVNMRFFEGLASGALLVTDRIGNGLEEIGEHGKHFVVYETAEEAIELIEYYLAHDAEREEIAARGQALALAEHTYSARLRTIMATVCTSPVMQAPARSAKPRLERLWRSQFMRIRGAEPKAIGRLLAGGTPTWAIFQNAAFALALRFWQRWRKALPPSL
jgi:hypothetical protein